VSTNPRCTLPGLFFRVASLISGLMSRLTSRLMFLLIFGLHPGLASAQAAATPRDILLPLSSPDQANVGPLAMATILTGDPVATCRFYAGAMDMGSRSANLAGAEAQAFAASLGLPPGQRLNVTVYSRADLQGAAQVRVVEVPADRPLARPAHDARMVGPLSMGFPVRKVEDRSTMMTAYGWAATAGVTSITLPMGDGTTYTVKETHFQAPDGVLSLGIDRAALRPVGPTDAALDIGGPAYVGIIVSDTQAMDVFLDKVLGFEKRRDIVLASSGPTGGLGLPTGTRFTFQQWFAPGTSTGHVVVMQHLNAGLAAPHRLGQGARGIAGWSFEGRDLAAVFERARAHNTTVLSPIGRRWVAGLGMLRTLVLATPDGMPVEIIEAAR